MPKVTVYIRNEDYELWKAVNEKTEFIHGALKSLSGHVVSTKSQSFKPVNTPLEAIKVLVNNKVCKHGFAPEFCRFAKAGKPCK